VRELGRWIGTAWLAGCGAALADGEQTWESVACVPADPALESLFNPVSGVDDFERESVAWKVTAGSQNAEAALARDTAERHGGAAALRVAYSFAGKKDYEYVQLEGRAAITNAGLALGFWLKSDGTPFSYRLRLADKGGEIHQLNLQSTPRQAGWQYVAAALDGESTSWGGDANHRKDYPLRLVGILIDRPSPGFVGKGALWLDDVALLEKRSLPASSLAVTCAGRRFGNLYAVGERVTLRANGRGERIRWRLEDFWGNGVSAGQGRAGGTDIAFALDRAGYFAFTLELLDGDEVRETVRFPCAALPEGRVAAASDYLGMCTHYGHRSYPLETMELMRRYGIDQFRDEISWRSVERVKGHYALPAHADEYLRRARSLAMRPLLIFDYSNPHYDDDGFPNSPEAIAAFAAYATNLVRLTRGGVSQFEVWNEWCGGCGMKGKPGIHDGAAYGRLLKPTYEAVKRAFPEVTVVGMGGEYGTRCAENIVDAIGAAGPDAMDAWSIHPYRYPRPPESSDLAGEVNRIADRVAAAGARSPAWVTEIGYPTQRDARGSTLAEQARHAVRTLACLQGSGRVSKVFWYDFKDDGLDRSYNEHNFGLVHHQTFNCAPKPAVVALSVWIRLTAGAAFTALRQDGEVWTASYRFVDGRDVLVAWTTSGAREVRVGGRVERAADLMGARFACGGTLRLTEDPVYLVGKRLALEAL
jgi:hypothetical protein